MPTPVTVTVTGAAGQIGYAALFRIAAGAMLGHDTPVALRLLELPSAVRAAEGVVMELDDFVFQLLASTEALTDAEEAVEQAIADREAAAEAAEAARDRLRDQIVASYVTGGQDEGLLEALLQSVPSAAKGRKSFFTIEGDIPSAANPPSGCRFHTRCPIAVERCSSERPALREVMPGHLAACHLAATPANPVHTEELI